MRLSMSKIRKWSRNIHRDLSFIFSGVLIVYAISGIALNHKDTFNTNYSISKKEFTLTHSLPPQDDVTKESIMPVLKELGEEKNYTKHYFPQQGQMKVFLKGGSNLYVDLTSGKAVYESVTKRPFLSAVSRLHYNPGKWWTIFSDVFCVSLLVIVLTGFLIVKGKKGLWGIGGIELLAGILIPLIFLFFF